MNQNRLLWFLSFAIFGMGFIQLLITIQPMALDDAFVYYTYARNLVEGRLFAYDIRNIPSEGFTSFIYLMVLSPFEFFGVNMLFASVLINVSAIILTIWVACRLSVSAKLLNQSDVLIFASLLWLFIINDSNIINSINMGLETMLGPLVIFMVTWAIWGTSSTNPVVNKRALTAFFVLLFIAYLVRPESFAFIAVVGIPLLMMQPTLARRRIFMSIIIFALIFIAYHLLKLAIFGDIFPTGFYRKTNRGDGSEYVLEWIIIYILWLIPILWIIRGNLVRLIRKKYTRLITQRWVWFLCGITITMLLFFARTEPLVGYHFRFLMIPTFIIYATLLMAIVSAMSKFINRSQQKDTLINKYHITMIPIIAVSFSTLTLQLITPNGHPLWDRLNIYGKSTEASRTQIYLEFGEHLNQTLDNPHNISMLFGDAGAIPYVFQGKFIDFNGLTEPAIAHLFALPDGEEKTRQFTDYILSKNPDIALLSWGKVRDGRWATPKSNHSPFVQPIPIGLFQSYHNFGIRYACTIYSNYYEIHFGVWTASPYYEDVADALISYCQINGYTLPDGITIFDAETQQEVHFEGIAEVIIPPRDT